MTSVRNETTYELFNMNRLPITTDPGGRALERPGVVALVPAAGAHAPRGDKNKSKTIRFGRHNRFVQKGILILTRSSPHF